MARSPWGRGRAASKACSSRARETRRTRGAWYDQPGSRLDATRCRLRLDGDAGEGDGIHDRAHLACGAAAEIDRVERSLDADAKRGIRDPLPTDVEARRLIDVEPE